MKFLTLVAIVVALVVLVSAKSTKKDKVSDPSVTPKECRYEKGPWSDCDGKTKLKSRQLTLKNKNQTGCEPMKTTTKKCKKASVRPCKYEKGIWSECNSERKMMRTDNVKPNSNPACESQRQVTKKCKKANHKKTLNNNNNHNNHKALEVRGRN